MKRLSLLFIRLALINFLLLISHDLFAQGMVDQVYKTNIHSARLIVANSPLSLPIYRLNSGDQLHLSFDDMDADVKDYYYTYQLCDYNWQPAQLNPFDYIKGFTQQQITSYRNSSISYTHYTHYDITLPDPGSLPQLSGNYIVKVFLDGDTSQVVFTKRMLIVENSATVAAQVVQPFTLEKAKTHQRIRFDVNVNGLDMFDAGQQIKIEVLQNNRWDNAQGNIQPTFIRGNALNYDNEDEFVFPGGNEWRWLDLRSFRTQSDREQSFNNAKDRTEITVKPDIDRSTQHYMFYSDLDGEYTLQNFDGFDPSYQADYAIVHFSFAPPGQVPYEGKNLYLIGRLTDYVLSDATKLNFNPLKGDYEITQFLKQGYYNYGYLLVDQKDPTQRTELNGDHFDTENSYTILVYYKSFSDLNDRLISISTINSRTAVTGNSF
jgi:type 9 secretion system plug protein